MTVLTIPALGGFITTYIFRHWIFLINLPALSPAVGIGSVAAGTLATLEDGAFRAASIGSVLLRISAGAVPFLMPLMLQSASGSICFSPASLPSTFSGAVGAITTKFYARRMLAFAGKKRSKHERPAA
ncbi:hypothetical protein OIU34_38885 [Pararhizobium sp. BT-229]|nr:hypothetical protein [Pararhizobium sp. BT-229]